MMVLNPNWKSSQDKEMTKPDAALLQCFALEKKMIGIMPRH